MTSRAQFARILAAPEGERIEFKKAANRFGFDELVQYCVALANEGGGMMVLGVTDLRPRRVAGTTAFPEPGRTESGIYERVGHRVALEEYDHEGQRVLIAHVPARLPGTAWSDGGRYWMRAGDSLVPMSDERLRQIHAEVAPDFSAEVCRGATVADLDRRAIGEFKRRWARRSRDAKRRTWSDAAALRNAELLDNGKITNAALLLFSTRSALTKHIPQAEIVFEYRSGEAPGPAQDRAEFREGFLLFHDVLWERIDRRNDRQSWQDGFFRNEISTFDEKVIREAVLNAFCHRDYRDTRSVFVRQYPARIEITNAGGFPPGITPANILDEQNPRNRRLAEALARCGLVERAGQGLDLMVSRSVQQGKRAPDFSRTVPHEVRLTLDGRITDPQFLAFLERVGRRTLSSFSAHDLLVLDHLHREERVPPELRPRLPRLIRLGVVETVGRGRGTRHLLSRRVHAALGSSGAYTRQRGLDRAQNKALLLRHIEESAEAGAKFEEFQQALPALSRSQIQALLRELRREGRIVSRGVTKAARWLPAPENQSESIRSNPPEEE